MSAQNYIDSIASSIQNYTEEQQIELLLAIPYDKVVANTSVAEKLYLDALGQAKQLKDKEAEADIYNQLALINAFLGNNDKRLDFNLKAIKIYEATNNKSNAGITYAELGFAMKRRDIDKAIEYMQKGVHLLKEINDEVALNSVYDNYGIVQEIAGNVDSAIYYYNMALDLKRNQNDSIGIPFALGHLSGAYLVKKDYNKSKEYLDESYAIRKKRNDTYGIAECLVLYADFYYAQENYKEALKWFVMCYYEAIPNKYIHLGQYAAEHAAICYEKIGDNLNTVKFLKIQQALKDSLLNESTNNAIAKLEVQFDTEKKEKEIAEQKAEISAQELKVKQRNYMMLVLGLIVLLFFVIASFIYKQQKQKQQRLFEENRLKDQLAQITLQSKLHEERLKISRDLHDNIGAQLTFIISSVDNMKHFFKSADEKLTDKLTDVANFSRTTITQLRDTIWALNKDEISFEDLKSRLYKYIENANLAQEQTVFNFNVELSNNFHLNSIQGVSIYRVVQEAINNAMKYAAATNVSLLITEKNDFLVLSINDDGIGFKMAEIQLGNGLENMKNRASAIHANFAINSTPKEGTEIILEIPIAEFN
ncbi:tetratricopeptide repeat-containing sensor histidine kinase [Vicingus serpentipes]|nr:sensor histidine kinase [Vicingus serpentipes]